ncbi:MAG TPA: prepilin-type N-terminal cleavage/methylation domain-containing protein [Myxococcales bacterium LLY-WYZ-16_1]|nr:prepilin-type N-terminal cleavage/methylation domain-containing protein [Myxococcales bacterium LLY-WYZ-16_1]
MHPATPHARRRPRAGRAGFSIIEALVSAAVLGIGLAALVSVHLSSVKGVDNSNEMVVARSLAVQLADEAAASFEATGTVFLGACDRAAADRANFNCATSNGSGFVAPAFPNCVRYFEEGAAPNAGSTLFQSGALVDPGVGYRAGVFASAHPDASVGIGTRVIDAVVCWRDPLNPSRVRELWETRVATNP